MVKINNQLLQDATFRQQLEASFTLIEQKIENKTLWNCGITSKGVVIISNDDGKISKIVFLVKQLFGYIDTSSASMQELKQRVRFTEHTDLTAKCADLNRKISVAQGVLSAKTDKAEEVARGLKNLETSVDSKKSESSALDKNIAAKKKTLGALEEKLKAIAQEEELEAKLQAKRLATQAITQEIEAITEGLAKKHAELIQRIGESKLGAGGVGGWIANASQMIQEKEKALTDHLSQDVYIKASDSFGVVLDAFRRELPHLKSKIPLITSSTQYADFLSQLRIIETTGWNYTYYDRTYCVTPKDLCTLEKTILREIKELAELTFTRSQMMALAT